MLGRFKWAVLPLVLFAGAAAPAEPTRPVPYLASGDLPDGLAVIAPAPAAGSAADAADRAFFRQSRALQGTPRWSQALADTAILEPGAFRSWSCAAGVAITEAGTPRTWTLLRRVAVDAGLGTYPAKAHYGRPRPFVGEAGPVCAPTEPLRGNASYPSGHAAVGWAWALILAELRPAQTTAILVRGREFGDSRAICGVHFMSDVEAGRLYAAGVVARLHADPQFQADLAAARRELETRGADPAAASCDAAAPGP